MSHLVTKPTKWHVRPAKTQISLGIRPLSAQRRLLSDWADAQADLSLRWAHVSVCWFWHEMAHIDVIRSLGLWCQVSDRFLLLPGKIFLSRMVTRERERERERERKRERERENNCNCTKKYKCHQTQNQKYPIPCKHTHARFLSKWKSKLVIPKFINLFLDSRISKWQTAHA